MLLQYNHLSDAYTKGQNTRGTTVHVQNHACVLCPDQKVWTGLVLSHSVHNQQGGTCFFINSEDVNVMLETQNP